MNELWGALMIAVLGGGGLQALISQLASRHRAQAEATHVSATTDQVIVATYGDILDDLKRELFDLREENKRMKERLEYLESQHVAMRQEIAATRFGASLLRAQVERLGHEPDWVLGDTE